MEQAAHAPECVLFACGAVCCKSWWGVCTARIDARAGLGCRRVPLMRAQPVFHCRRAFFYCQCFTAGDEDEAGLSAFGFGNMLAEGVEDLFDFAVGDVGEMSADKCRFAQGARRDGLAAVGADDDVGAGAVARMEPDIVAAGDVAGEFVVVAGGAAGDDEEAVAAAQAAEAGARQVFGRRPRGGRGAREHGAQGGVVMGGIEGGGALIERGKFAEGLSAAASDGAGSAVPFFRLMTIPADVFLW